MYKNITFCFRAALLASSILVSTSVLAGEVVKNVNITGNKRIETATVESYLGIRPGQSFDGGKQSEALKRLYATSMFEDVRITYNNGALLVHVIEAPFISKVEIKGNSKIKAANISKELLTQSGDSLSKAKIQQDIYKILEMYKVMGRFAVSAEAQTEKLSDGRVKVIFKISEGPKAVIRDIYFSGNHNYSSSELKSIVATKETAWFKFLDTNDTYNPDRMEYDRELLRQFYRSVGFAEMRVISATAELSQTKEYFTATYSIEEGPKYDFGKIDVQSKIAEISPDLAYKYIKVKSGQVFNMSALERIADKITEELGNKGYPQVSVTPTLQQNYDARTVDVTFVIENADKVFIDKINIFGNPRTDDKVIRREFRIQEGDIFNRSRVEQGERGVVNLNYFEKVQVKMAQTANIGRYDINVDVQEKSTASIGLDLGYSTAEGPFGNISYAERNLLGTGKHLNAGIHRARRRVSYTLGMVDPHFLDRDVSLGGTLFNVKSGNSKFDGIEGTQGYSLNTYGAKANVGYEIVDDLTHDVEYMIKSDKLSVDVQTASIFIREQVGKYITSSVGHTITYDQTDNRIIPKNGYIVSGTQEYGGVGGDNHYLKHELDGKAFKSVMNNKLTFKIAGAVGDVMGTDGKTVRITDRFKVGDYNLRGFAPGGIGPRVKGTDEGLGGLKFYTVTAEVNFPVGLPEEMNVTGDIFCDVGGLWGVDIPKNALYSKKDLYDSKSPRVSVGAGILWLTRIAPIKVDWGIPIKYKKYDDQQRWHIRFSTHF